MLIAKMIRSFLADLARNVRNTLNTVNVIRLCTWKLVVLMITFRMVQKIHGIKLKGSRKP